MANKLVNRTRLSSTINNEKYNELKKLSDDTSVPLSRLLDKGIELLMKKYEGKR